ncbi:hypothetical protein ACTXT7_006455 [Hymenolepis weldensis]
MINTDFKLYRQSTMAQVTSHSRSTSTVTSRTTLSEQQTTTTSANLIRTRSSTLHAYNSTNIPTEEVRTSTLLNHSESEMSSSMHVTKTSTLLAPLSNDLELKPKSSPWFWRRRYTSRTSLVRSASTNKANEGGDSQWMSNGDSGRPSGDEAYDSKTSTLSSAVTIDGVASVVRNKSVARSVSTKDTKSGGGFLRFLRASFASRPKRSSEVKPGTQPLSMTQSGLASLAGKQTNIAKIFADPNNRLSNTNLQLHHKMCVLHNHMKCHTRYKCFEVRRRGKQQKRKQLLCSVPYPVSRM